MQNLNSADEATHAFKNLDPVQILDAIDSVGWQTDGRVSALNSYENRVYSVGLENGDSLIAKFYRPGRWNDDTILEEHEFCFELQRMDLPIVAPYISDSGKSLHHAGLFRFTLYPRSGGRSPDLDNATQLETIGRTIARMHLRSESFAFRFRPEISAERLGDDCADFLLDNDFMPYEQACIYESVIDELLPIVHETLDSVNYQTIGLHGDFHPGNILWGGDDTPIILDFDDAASGPAIQDLWMFISGERSYAEARLANLLDAYHEFREFNVLELALIEPLRTLRIIHYAAWIAMRWQDPAFTKAFPFFASARFWDDHIHSLREQLYALQEPCLVY